MVLQSDAVVDPRTMVVEPLDTVSADLTVSAAARSNRAVVRAQLRAVNDVQHVFEVHISVLEVPRILTRRQREEDEAHDEDEKVKQDGPVANI